MNPNPVPYFAMPLTRDQWRYHFAGLAMQGMLASGLIPDQARTAMDQKDWDYAKSAVMMAEALLAELEKPK